MSIDWFFIIILIESRPVRQWTVRVYELLEGNSKPPEVGHAIVVTAPGLGPDSQDGCDAISGDLETVMKRPSNGSKDS
ncbi:hypothetical protein IV102_01450 [bacterium]|nr:hypothetical protein [bacterium]